MGAVGFTLLQTVLGLQTDLWALYTGIIFILTVMYAPSGFTGVVTMHFVPWQLGKINLLFKPYAKIMLPALVFIVGITSLIELTNHVRHHSQESSMTLYWVTFESNTIVPWIVLLAMTFGGFYACKFFAREVIDAWSDATYVEKG